MFHYSLILTTALLLSVPASYSAEVNTERIPLFFPIENNQIQVLPQKFEYTLLDSEKIKIGDLLIDTQQLKFELVRMKQSTKFRFRFTWPSSLFQEGTMTLLNNNGIGVWTKKLVKSTSSVLNPTKSENPGLRADVGQMISPEISEDLFEDMKYFPFMRYCISYFQEGTKIKLCSKEFFLTAQNGTLSIKVRPTNFKKSRISINGKDVEAQGLIFLNDISQPVSLRMQTLSGAILETDTRMKEVEFLDMALDKDKKSLIVRARGAEPVSGSIVETFANGQWQTKIPSDRPVVYLQGEGGIPLRQEFFLKANPPPADMRVFLAADTPQKTYSSNISVKGSLPPKTQIKPLRPQDGIIEALDSQQFQWTLGDLHSGELNRYYATLITPQGRWVTNYEAYRSRSLVVSGKAQMTLPWNQQLIQFAVQKWFENFLTLPSSLFYQRWSLGIQHMQSLSQKSDTPSLSQTDLDLAFRLQPGLLFKDPSWIVKIILTQFKVEETSLSTVGLGISHQGPNTITWLNRFLTQRAYSLDYYLPTSSSGFEFKGLIKAQMNWLHNFNDRTLLDVSFHYQQWQLPSSTNVANSQLGFGIGAKYLF